MGFGDQTTYIVFEIATSAFGLNRVDIFENDEQDEILTFAGSPVFSTPLYSSYKLLEPLCNMSKYTLIIIAPISFFTFPLFTGKLITCLPICRFNSMITFVPTKSFLFCKLPSLNLEIYLTNLKKRMI